MIKEFKINTTDDEISNIISKINSYPWTSIEESEAWSLGTNKEYLNKKSSRRSFFYYYRSNN